MAEINQEELNQQDVEQQTKPEFPTPPEGFDPSKKPQGFPGGHHGGFPGHGGPKGFPGAQGGEQKQGAEGETQRQGGPKGFPTPPKGFDPSKKPQGFPGEKPQEAAEEEAK